MKRKFAIQFVCLLLTALLLVGGLASCSRPGEVPEGYQYATANGAYFRLFVPTQWTVQTQNGVSGATIGNNASVTMEQIAFEPVEGETKEDGTEKSALEQFADAHIAQVSTLSNYNAEKNLAATVSGNTIAARDITYTVTVYDESDEGTAYRVRQVLIKAEGRYYLFTYSAKVDVFDMYLDAVDGMLQMLQFINIPYTGAEEREPGMSDAPDGMVLVSGNDVAFRFYAPADWKIDTDNGNCLVYVSDEDRSNVSVLPYSPSEEGVSVAKYWEMTEAKYQKTFEEFALCGEPEATKLGGKDAMAYTYTYRLGGVAYKSRQVIAVYSAALYSMTYTALPENYDQHIEDVNAMQEALEFRAWGR